MKKVLFTLLVSIVVLNCKTKEDPKVFSAEALQDVLITRTNNTTTFKDVLNKNKEKTIVIDVWASWCGDCLKSLPKVKAMQREHPNVEFVFLSLDKKITSWKNGIKKHNITGQHYYLKSGWDGPLGKFLDLDWIPRYIVVNKNQNISVFYSKDIQSPIIKSALL